MGNKYREITPVKIFRCPAPECNKPVAVDFSQRVRVSGNGKGAFRSMSVDDFSSAYEKALQAHLMSNRCDDALGLRAELQRRGVITSGGIGVQSQSDN